MIEDKNMIWLSPIAAQFFLLWFGTWWNTIQNYQKIWQMSNKEQKQHAGGRYLNIWPTFFLLNLETKLITDKRPILHMYLLIVLHTYNTGC